MVICIVKNVMKTNVKVFYAQRPVFTEEQLQTKNYILVYEEEREKIDFDEELVVCDELFERFNIGDHGGKQIRSMSVGDKVVFDNYVQYICANIGWKRIGN